MRARLALALVFTALFAGATACRKPVDTTEFKSAINQSFAGRHECLWPEPIKLPVQADPSKDERVRDYDALTDAGLFIRESVEKKRPLALSQQLFKYDLSDKGHSSWTPDPGRPGYGNFCFGHFNVTAIVKATPNDASNPTQYTVNYRYEVEGIPEWIRTPESMRAFRNIAADTSIQSATATMVKAPDGSWTVAPQQPAP
jgi:hypothetical protein